jgi:hypothetical protein
VPCALVFAVPVALAAPVVLLPPSPNATLEPVACDVVLAVSVADPDPDPDPDPEPVVFTPVPVGLPDPDGDGEEVICATEPVTVVCGTKTRLLVSVAGVVSVEGAAAADVVGVSWGFGMGFGAA